MGGVSGRATGFCSVLLGWITQRSFDYDQDRSCWSCYPYPLRFCRFGRAADPSSPRDECICRYALWSLRLRISQEGLRARAARRRVRDSALDRRANVPSVLVSLCASKVRRVVVVLWSTADQAARFAIFAIVARLQPVAACIVLQDWPAAIMRPIAALRSTSSARPLYRPSAFALACPCA